MNRKLQQSNLHNLLKIIIHDCQGADHYIFINNINKNFCDIVIMPTWGKLRHKFSHEHNIGT